MSVCKQTASLFYSENETEVAFLPRNSPLRDSDFDAFKFVPRKY